MKPLLEQIEAAAVFDIEKCESRDGFYVRGAYHQHAQLQWQRDALIKALNDLIEVRNYLDDPRRGGIWNSSPLHEQIKKTVVEIAALVPGGEK